MLLRVDFELICTFHQQLVARSQDTVDGFRIWTRRFKVRFLDTSVCLFLRAFSIRAAYRVLDGDH